MKRVLTIGSGSYIAKAFAVAAEGILEVCGIPGRGDVWRETDFGGYDAVLYCAGMVHQKQRAENRHLYDEINRHMAVDVAQKAKKAGVSQFVYLSSMSVYGRETGVITAETQPAPKLYDWYGMSKWKAEQALAALSDEQFALTVLRPPMVYGPNCPGNFARLAGLAGKIALFPDIRNKRSMIYAGNLGQLLCAVIEQRRGGVFCPQNRELVCTSELVRLMGETAGRPIRLTKVFNPAVRPAAWCVSAVGKMFHDYYYEPEMSVLPGIEYQSVGLEESVRRSIGDAVSKAETDKFSQSKPDKD